MAPHVPLPAVLQTSADARPQLVALAVVRAGLAAGAVLLAPWLYREHTAALVLLRPTKEVFLFAGFQAREGDVFLPVAILAALPLLLGGVWLFFGLGRAYAEDLESAALPGIAGRMLPKARLDELRGVLEDRGMRVVFLGRLAMFPSSLMAAAAGSAGVPWHEFVVADTAGALTSLALALGAGYVLGETYEEAGPWLTVVGAIALVAVAVVVGRALVSRPGSRS